MGYSVLKNMPMIGNIFKAEEVYNNIKPIRGTDVRPLGTRRAKHYSIEKSLLGGYMCKLYGHPVLWYEMAEDGKGTILHVSLCGYDTQTTRGFIQFVTPFDCYTHNRKAYIEIGRRTLKNGKYKVTNAHYLPANNPAPLRIYIPHGGDYGEAYLNARVLNPVPVTKKILDREITKELRDKYKDSMAEAEAMLNLGPARYSGEYNPSEKEADFRGQFMEDLTREEITEYLWIMASFHMNERRQNQRLQYNINTRNYESIDKPQPPSRSYIVNALYEIASRDAIDIHKEVELPVGRRG
jgi:hypothetical protein